MQTSAKGVAFIAAFEGVITKAYRDVGGTWTIGIGHTAAAGPPAPVVAGMSVSRDEAYAILASDLKGCEGRVDSALPGVPQTVFDGAVSFEFNTGAIDRASWVTAYLDGDRDAARADLMLWVKAGGRTVAGLVRRRQAEADLILSGQYGPGADKTASSVATEPSRDEVRTLQTSLATLGFYRGAVDGIAGPDTTAAVRAYQAAHPDLVVDGVAGPATMASLARDSAARTQIGGPAAVGLVGTLLAGVTAFVTGGQELLPMLTAAVVLFLAGMALVRHRGDLARIFHLGKG